MSDASTYDRDMSPAHEWSVGKVTIFFQFACMGNFTRSGMNLMKSFAALQAKVLDGEISKSAAGRFLGAIRVYRVNGTDQGLTDIETGATIRTVN